jgi:halocyanin-like protein
VIGSSANDTTTTEAPTLTPPDSLDDWLADANGYEGEIKRYGPRSQPEILVGEPIDGEMAFAPPVIEVAPMSNVHWEWTGHGGQHNVVALDGTFDSGRTNAQPGISYHYVFDEPGEYPFVSEPHYEDGMKGAVIVQEPPSTGNQAVDEWVVDSSNFDGSVTDRTGVDTATITVGAEDARGNFAFDPPVLKVSVGITVQWEWSGRGGPHNVVFQNRDISSDEIYSDPGVHLEHTFEKSGTYRFACEPHQSIGMKGAIIVE